MIADDDVEDVKCTVTRSLLLRYSPTRYLGNILLASAHTTHSSAIGLAYLDCSRPSPNDLTRSDADNPIYHSRSSAILSLLSTRLGTSGLYLGTYQTADCKSGTGIPLIGLLLLAGAG